MKTVGYFAILARILKNHIKYQQGAGELRARLANEQDNVKIKGPGRDHKAAGAKY
jgi:hypothetical protein